MPSRWYTLLALPFPDQHLGRRDLTARRGNDHPYSFTLSAAHRAGYFSNPSLQTAIIAPLSHPRRKKSKRKERENRSILIKPTTTTTTPTLHATIAQHQSSRTTTNYYAPPSRVILVKVNESKVLLNAFFSASSFCHHGTPCKVEDGYSALHAPKHTNTLLQQINLRRVFKDSKMIIYLVHKSIIYKEKTNRRLNIINIV